MAVRCVNDSLAQEKKCPMDSPAAFPQERRSSLPQRRAAAGRPRVLRWLALCVTAAGCQTYERDPLDLAARLDAVASRATQLAPQTAQAFDLADGITLDEAEVMALIYGADLRIARAEAGVAAANARTAGLWNDPVVGLNAAEFLSPSGPFEFGGRINLSLPVSGRLKALEKEANAAHRAALRRVWAQEWSYRNDVRRAWIEWTVAVERGNLLRTVVNQFEAIEAVASRLEKAGAIRSADRRLLRIELLGRQTDLSLVEYEVADAKARLFGLMGLFPGAPFKLLPGLPVSDDERPADLTHEALAASNPELLVLCADYETAERTLALEIARQYPDLGLGLGASDDIDGTRAELGLSIPLPVWNRNARPIEIARAERELARMRAETAAEAAVRRLARARIQLDRILAGRRAVAEQIVPLLEEQRANLARLAELGDVDTFLALETVGRQFSAEARLLDLVRQEALVRVSIAEVQGPPEERPYDATGTAAPPTLTPTDRTQR